VRIEEPCYEGQHVRGGAVEDVGVSVRPGRCCLQELLLPLLIGCCLLDVVLGVFSTSCKTLRVLRLAAKVSCDMLVCSCLSPSVCSFAWGWTKAESGLQVTSTSLL
jgi:hypothetical protein